MSFDLLSVVALVGVFAAFGVWRVLAARRHRPRPEHSVRTVATVEAVEAIDVGSGRDTETHYRLVLSFTQEEGVRVVVDRTCDLSAREKDILLPGAQVTIVYDRKEPEERWSIFHER